METFAVTLFVSRAAVLLQDTAQVIELTCDRVECLHPVKLTKMDFQRNGPHLLLNSNLAGGLDSNQRPPGHERDTPGFR